MAVWQIAAGVAIGVVSVVIGVIINSWNSSKEQGYSEPRFYSPPGDICSICLENMFTSAETVYLNCGHAFHERCIRDLRKYKERKCPICRSNI